MSLSLKGTLVIIMLGGSEGTVFGIGIDTDDFLLGASPYAEFFTYSTYLAEIVLTARNVSVNVTEVSAVPEPETYAMLLAGLGLMGFLARRRKA